MKVHEPGLYPCRICRRSSSIKTLTNGLVEEVSQQASPNGNNVARLEFLYMHNFVLKI